MLVQPGLLQVQSHRVADVLLQQGIDVGTGNTPVVLESRLELL